MHHWKIRAIIEKGVTVMISIYTPGPVHGQRWYVETDIRRDGPFASREEAARFIRLLNTVSLAG